MDIAKTIGIFVLPLMLFGEGANEMQLDKDDVPAVVLPIINISKPVLTDEDGISIYPASVLKGCLAFAPSVLIEMENGKLYLVTNKQEVNGISLESGILTGEDSESFVPLKNLLAHRNEFDWIFDSESFLAATEISHVSLTKAAAIEEKIFKHFATLQYEAISEDDEGFAVVIPNKAIVRFKFDLLYYFQDFKKRPSGELDLSLGVEREFIASPVYSKKARTGKWVGLISSKDGKVASQKDLARFLK